MNFSPLFYRNFANVSTEFKFPKPMITSKMIPIAQGAGLLISCLSKNPLVIYQDGKFIIPGVEKDPLLPMKPIQKLQVMTESNGILILGHGERCLEFAKLDFEEDCLINRTCQKSSPVPYSVNHQEAKQKRSVINFEFKKLHFTANDHLVGVGENQVDFWDVQKQHRLAAMVSI
jgi:hypothetical protein